MCWHFDHTVGKSVRGINMLNALYYSNSISIPVAFEIIKKPIEFSEITLDSSAVSTIYEKRWKVEEFYKSIKHNSALAKSPTKTIKTQSNHIFLAIYSFFKLECLKIKHHLNHFALRMKLLVRANQVAYLELQKMKSA